MNKYRVIYYVALVALLVGVFLIIGTDLGWFNLYQGEQSFINYKKYGQDTIPDRFLLQNDKNLKLFDKYACQK